MNKEMRVFTVKFDLVQNVEECLKTAAEEDIKNYLENKEECTKKFMILFKLSLMSMLDFGDEAWIENVEVEEIKD